MTRFGAVMASRRRSAPKVPPPYVTSAVIRTLAGTTNVIGALPGASPGNIAVAILGGSNTGNVSVTPPAGLGWTKLADSDAGTLTDVAGRMTLWVTTITSVNQAGGTWTWSGSGDHWAGIAVYSGALLPTSAAITKVTGVRSINAPSVTPIANQARAVWASFWTNGGSAMSWVGSVTTRFAPTSGTTGGSIVDEPVPVAAATGTRLYTTSVTGTIATATVAAGVVLEAA